MFVCPSTVLSPQPHSGEGGKLYKKKLFIFPKFKINITNLSMLLSEKVMLLTETFSSLSTVTTDDGTASVFAETIKQQQPTTSENQRTVQL